MHMSNKNSRRDETADALRIVTPEEAFYFYVEIGRPLGAASRSLDEFVVVVKDVDPSSVRFHVERGDFENWFRLLGDKSLAGQVAALRGKSISPQELRGKVSSMVSTRVGELHKTGGSKSTGARARSARQVRS
jgi:hypothetical protein